MSEKRRYSHAYERAWNALTAQTGTGPLRERVALGMQILAPLMHSDLPGDCQAIIDEVGAYFAEDGRPPDVRRTNLVSAWDWARMNMPAHLASRFSKSIVTFAERIFLNAEVWS